MGLRSRKSAIVARIALLLFALGGAGLAGARCHYNQEGGPLDAAARRRAPGSFARLPRGLVHYQLGGPADGAVVVLVHGFSVPQYIWDPTYAALTRAGFRVLRYDLYGRGYSARPDVPYDADLFDEQLERLLVALRITKPVKLVGLSMGGPIAVTFTDRHPARVDRLALIDPLYRGPRPLSWKLRWPLVGEWTMLVSIAPKMATGQLDDFHRPERFPGWPARYREQMRYRGFRRAILSTIREGARADVRPAYARVGRQRREVLLIWGKQDRTLPFANSEKVRAALANARFLAVDRAGHLPQMERPDLVNPTLIAFLEGATAASAATAP